MTGNTDMHLLVTDTFLKNSLVWQPFASRSMTQFLRIELECCPTLLHMSIQSIPNTLNGWHVWWVCRPWKSWYIFSFQELCIDHCDMRLCIIMLKYEVMAGDKWHDNGPQDLVTVSLCIQIAIDKIQLCSLSIAFAGPYHTPSATMGHSGHNVDISKPLAILAVCHFIVPSTRCTCVNMFFFVQCKLCDYVEYFWYCFYSGQSFSRHCYPLDILENTVLSTQR